MTDRGVIVEFDFTAMDGAELLFKTTRDFLNELDRIKLDTPLEARFLSGKDLLAGLQALFQLQKTRKTAVKAARDLGLRYRAAFTAAVPKAVGIAFRNFIATLRSEDVRVIVVTRADVGDPAVQAAFAPLLGEKVLLCQDTSSVYGGKSWEDWRKICLENRIHHSRVFVVTGTGFGVRAALLAGMGCLAVIRDHVSYQDFCGASDALEALGNNAARKVLARLK